MSGTIYQMQLVCPSFNAAIGILFSLWARMTQFRSETDEQACTTIQQPLLLSISTKRAHVATSFLCSDMGTATASVASCQQSPTSVNQMWPAGHRLPSPILIP